MNLQIPTRTVSESTTYGNYATLSGTYSSPSLQQSDYYKDDAIGGTASGTITVSGAVRITQVFTNNGAVSYSVSGNNRVNYTVTGVDDEGIYTITVRYYSSYPTASDSYYRSNLQSVSYSSGTRPDSLYRSGNYIYSTWTSTNFSDAGKSVSCRVYYTYTGYVNRTYANVYFNGTRVNYVYFNGTRYP